MIEAELQAHCLLHPETSQWLSEIHKSEKNLMEMVAELSTCDPRRLAALNPALLRRVVNSQHGIHLRVATTLKPIQDMIMIQRSQASSLPTSEGDPIPLRGLFKKMIRKTAIVERTPEEEIEYQYFHREAAQ
jgi:hypothetical protein